MKADRRRFASSGLPGSLSTPLPGPVATGTKALRLVAAVEEVTAAFGLVLVVAITIYNIVNRYLLLRSAAWAPELAGMIFAWVVFLGASAAWRRHMHISIAVVVRLLSPRLQVVIAKTGELLLACFFAYSTYLAIKITLSSHTRLSPVMRVPFSYVYASAAVGFALMLLHQIAALAQSLRRFKGLEH